MKKNSTSKFILLILLFGLIPLIYFLSSIVLPKSIFPNCDFNQNHDPQEQISFVDLQWDRISTLDTSLEYVTQIAFNNDGSILYVAGRDGIEVISMENFEVIQNLESGTITSISISHNNLYLIAGTYSGRIMVWDLETYDLLSESIVSEYQIRDIAIAHDDSFLIVASEKMYSLQSFDLPTLSEQRVLRSYDVVNGGITRSVSILHDDTCLLVSETPPSSTGGGSMYLIEINNLSVSAFPQTYIGDINSVDVHPFLPLAISSGGDEFMRFWNLQNQEEILEEYGAQDRVDFNRNGNILVGILNEEEYRISLWTVENGNIIDYVSHIVSSHIESATISSLDTLAFTNGYEISLFNLTSR